MDDQTAQGGLILNVLLAAFIRLGHTDTSNRQQLESLQKLPGLEAIPLETLLSQELLMLRDCRNRQLLLGSLPV